MLKDILDRGFSEQSDNYILPPGMFNFINASTNNLITFPGRKLMVLEGLPGAGKTTIKEYFDKEFSFEVVDQILPNNPDEDKNLTLSDILNSDEEKTMIFKNTSKKNVLMDRYYASTLAYSWAYDKVFHTNTYSQVERWYGQGLSSGKLIKPFIVFLIEIPLDYSFLRKNRIEDNSSQNPWVRKDFLKYFAKYYAYFYSEIETKTLLVKIDGTKPLKEIVKIIKTYEKN